MSQFTGESQRPGMRRKSSAQNLLSSFKPSNTPSGSTTPVVPMNLPPSTTPSSSSLTFNSIAGSTGTQPSITPLVRDWDAQSLHSDTVGSSLGGAGSPPLGSGTSVDHLRDLVQKRIITLTYIRNIHEGRSHWFHTIFISRTELVRIFSNNDIAIKKRTYRFAILGMSLSNLLDINQPQDLLRGLLNTISEYDQAKEDNDKSKMPSKKRIFKPKGAKRGTSGVTEYTGSYTETSTDASYLVMPHTPFSLDYHQTLLSLLDVLSEVYNKISKLLGPSLFPHTSQHMAGPLGLLSPHPGVSYLFPGDAGSISDQSAANSGHPTNPSLHQTLSNNSSGLFDSDMSGSLWSIANPSGVNVNGGHGVLNSPPGAMWSASMGETVQKIDGKLKKITTTLLKDLDALARNGIQDELASLDPLLRNMNISEGGIASTGGKILYDFDAM